MMTNITASETPIPRSPIARGRPPPPQHNVAQPREQPEYDHNGQVQRITLCVKAQSLEDGLKDTRRYEQEEPFHQSLGH